MSRSSVLIFLGVMVALAPFLGLGSSVLSVLLPVIGLLIAGIAITFRPKRVRESEVLSYEAPTTASN